MLFNKKNKGFALIEVVLALVIMLIVTIAGIQAFKSMLLSNSENKVQNRVLESITVIQNLRTNMVAFLTNTTGVNSLVTASNAELAKNFNYLSANQIPVISSAGNTVGQLGILKTTVTLTSDICPGVAKYFLWNTSESFKGAVVTASGTGTVAASGIIDYSKTISKVGTNYALPIPSKTPSIALSAITQVCVNGATMDVYF